MAFCHCGSDKLASMVISPVVDGMVFGCSVFVSALAEAWEIMNCVKKNIKANDRVFTGNIEYLNINSKFGYIVETLLLLSKVF